MHLKGLVPESKIFKEYGHVKKETGASLKLPLLTHLGQCEHHEWILIGNGL